MRAPTAKGGILGAELIKLASVLGGPILDPALLALPGGHRGPSPVWGKGPPPLLGDLALLPLPLV